MRPKSEEDSQSDSTSENLTTDKSNDVADPDTAVLDAGPVTVADVLGNHGPFADSKPGFQERAEQQALATAIDQCIDESNLLVAEAGTGVGKTFAYLVPALTCNKRVIISTGTRHLQDQLFLTD